MLLGLYVTSNVVKAAIRKCCLFVAISVENLVLQPGANYLHYMGVLRHGFSADESNVLR